MQSNTLLHSQMLQFPLIDRAGNLVLLQRRCDNILAAGIGCTDPVQRLCLNSNEAERDCQDPLQKRSGHLKTGWRCQPLFSGLALLWGRKPNCQLRAAGTEVCKSSSPQRGHATMMVHQ